MERMSSSSSAAADCDSLSSPARRRTSSRPKRGLHSKLGTHGSASGNGNGSSSDEVEQDDKRRRSSRFVWTADLHRRFEDAVQRLGLKSAKPEDIRQLMGVDSESDVHTRKSINSHLQKYRAAHCCREAVEQSAEKQLVMQEDFLDVLETNGETSLSSPSLEAPATTNGLHPSIFFQDGIDKNDLAQVAGWREADAADIDSDVDNLPAHSYFELLGTRWRSVGDSSLVRVQTSTEATSVQTLTEAKDGPPLPTSQLPEVTHDLKASAKAASEWRQLERVQASPIRTVVAATASQASQPHSDVRGCNGVPSLAHIASFRHQRGEICLLPCPKDNHHLSRNFRARLPYAGRRAPPARCGEAAPTMCGEVAELCMLNPERAVSGDSHTATDAHGSG